MGRKVFEPSNYNEMPEVKEQLKGMEKIKVYDTTLRDGSKASA